MRTTWITLACTAALTALGLAAAPDAHAAPLGSRAGPLLHGGIYVGFGYGRRCGPPRRYVRRSRCGPRVVYRRTYAPACRPPYAYRRAHVAHHVRYYRPYYRPSYPTLRIGFGYHGGWHHHHHHHHGRVFRGIGRRR